MIRFSVLGISNYANAADILAPLLLQTFSRPCCVLKPLSPPARPSTAAADRPPRRSIAINLTQAQSAITCACPVFTYLALQDLWRCLALAADVEEDAGSDGGLKG